MDWLFLAAFALGASVPTLGYAIYLIQSYRNTKGREGDQATELGEPFVVQVREIARDEVNRVLASSSGVSIRDMVAGRDEGTT